MPSWNGTSMLFVFRAFGNACKWEKATVTCRHCTGMMESPQQGTMQEQPADSVVLEEEIDPNYIPSEQEVLEYVNWLGMDLEADKDLFWIAREGLMAPLPANWKPCKIKTSGDIYYFNFSTGESTWEHPCDEYYKRLYEEEKKKKEITLKVRKTK